MGVAGVLGMYDFYKWEYDYGHNLSDTAQIKIPGMAYQPPFFGGKELLNFYAESYPAGGTYAMVLAAVLALVAFFVAKKCTNAISVLLNHSNGKSSWLQGPPIG